MKISIEGNEIVIRLAISPAASASGKSTVLASTHGNIQAALTYQGEAIPVSVGVNVYTKAELKTKAKK